MLSNLLGKEVLIALGVVLIVVIVVAVVVSASVSASVGMLNNAVLDEEDKND